MSTDYDTIREIVIQKVRERCFAGVFISDDEIGKMKVRDLQLGKDGHRPGASPYDGLALSLKGHTEIDVPGLTGDKLKQIENLRVDNIAKFIYTEIISKNRRF